MRELPNAIEHEKRLLAAMTLDGGEKVPDVAEQITADEFYRQEHRAIFKAIINAYNGTTDPINETLVMDELERMKSGVSRAYFLSLTALEFTTARVNSYIKRIKETARLRQLINISAAVMECAHDEKPAAEITAELENLLYKADEPAPSQLEKASNIAVNVFKRAIQLSESDGLTGVPTGLYDFDRITNGLQKSDLIFLAARPAMGKTALALNIAVNAARAKKSVALFSLEMSKAQIGARLISSTARVPVTRINAGRFNDADRNNVLQSVENLDNLPLYIDDTPCLTVNNLRSKAQKFKREHDIDLIVIDYIQLMVGDRSNPNRVQEVSEISRNLKALAKTLNAPVLVLSQLSRNVEQRADKRPQLSDLRESGSLEQDADIVMFLYREEYYNREDCEFPDVAELIIAKNRNGATANIRLRFEKEFVLFRDLTRIDD